MLYVCSATYTPVNSALFVCTVTGLPPFVYTTYSTVSRETTGSHEMPIAVVVADVSTRFVGTLGGALGFRY